MHRYIQDPPFAVQVELTEGCNFVCSFCAISSIRKPDRQGYDYKYLSMEDARGIAARIVESGWSPRIEFGMHGEPSMNPNFMEIIRIFRQALPHSPILMESNGVGFMAHTPDRLIRIFNEGITNLVIEDYEGSTYCDYVRDVAISIKTALSSLNVAMFEYPAAGKSGNPHQFGEVRKLIFLEDPMKASKGTHSHIHNSAGLAAPRDSEDPVAQQRCAKPFREISIRWDANIALCCNDWRGDYKIGNALVDRLDDIWQSDAFTAARLKLYHKERDFGPCDGCTARSYRVGLLPDKFGMMVLPRPDREAERIIKHSLEGKSYTKAVSREWELVHIEGAK